MPYWQLFYHIVWATRNREPLISPDIEPIIFEFLRTKAIGLGAIVFALNGISDHVHLVTSIPPTIAISKFTGQVKAVATVKFNQSGHPKAPLYWQEGFGAFSFDRKRLPYLIQYVEKQKTHHGTHTEIEVLERIEGEGVKLIRETPNDYLSDFASWMEDLKRIG